MTRLARLYKKLLDVSLIVSYVLMILLVIALIFGIFVQAYDFSENAVTMFKPGFGYLRGILITLVTFIIVFVVFARVLLSYTEKENQLISAEQYRKILKKEQRKIVQKSDKRTSFSQTRAYTKLQKKKESKPAVEPKVHEEEVTHEELSFKDIAQQELQKQNESNQSKDEVISKSTENEKDLNDFAHEKEQKEIIADEKSENVVDQNKEVLVTSNIGPKTTDKKFYTRMTKSDLNTIVSKVTGLSNYKSRKFVNNLLEIIQDELVKGEDVRLDDFGRFHTRTVKEHQKINPQTKEPITIEEHRKVSFTPYKQFKEDITNDVIATQHRYLLTEDVKEELSEDEVQNELIKERKREEHVNQTVGKPMKKKKKPAVIKKTKADLINYIGENTDLSNNKAKKFLNIFTEVMAEELSNKNDIQIPEFGTFTTIKIPSKEAVNPANGEKIVVLEHHQVRLRFTKKYKDIINKK